LFYRPPAALLEEGHGFSRAVEAAGFSRWGTLFVGLVEDESEKSSAACEAVPFV
jgi:hypothetical protein